MCVFDLDNLDFAHLDGHMDTYLCTWSMYASAGTCSPDGPGDKVTARRHVYLYPFVK